MLLVQTRVKAVRENPNTQNSVQVDLHVLPTADSLGVSFSKEYYAENTPKFVIGYSVSGGRLWWSNGKASGDLFDGKHFNVTASLSSPRTLFPVNCSDMLCSRSRPRIMKVKSSAEALRHMTKRTITAKMVGLL